MMQGCYINKCFITLTSYCSTNDAAFFTYNTNECHSVSDAQFQGISNH